MPRENETFDLLLEASRLLSSKLDLADLLTTIMQLAAKVTGAEQASLLLLDDATRELYFDVALGLDPETSAIRLKLGQGIAGWVAETGRPLISDDVRADPRWSPKVDQRSGFVTRSILAAPLVVRGKLIGVVESINRRDGPFSPDDLRTFEAFASQAAVAIENARLFASLKAEKQNLEAVFLQMREAALLTDADGNVRLANETARRLLALPERATLAGGPEGFWAKPAIAEVLASREAVVPVELTRPEPKALVLDGTAFRLEARDAKDNQRPGWTWILRDVTEERRAEGLKREFLSLISHKLKTPLSAITGYSQILQAEASVKALPEFPLKALASIQAQGEKLNALVDKLLAFATLEQMDAGRLQRRAFQLEAAAREAAGSLETTLRSLGTRIEIEGAATALGDPDLVREVLRNLVDNALKFNPAARKKVAIRIRSTGGRAEASVEDDGPGIPPEDMSRLFDKFHQVEASFTGQVEGWGLGLPFCKRVIDRLGGTLSMESKLGRGTTVTFSVPEAGQ